MIFHRKKSEPPGEKNADWYDQAISDGHRVHYTESPYYFLWTVIADRAMRASVTSVLDIGCGTGQLGSLLKDMGLASYYGFDFSPKRIQQAQVLCPGYTFSVEDAYSTSLFETLEYDCVICTEFLEHVEGDKQMLSRIRPGTRFLGTVPNFPYVSHVRHFENKARVLERYAPHFAGITVDAFRGNAKGKTFFLIEGETRALTSA